MNMNLKSFPKFKKHEDKVQKLISKLQEKIDHNEAAIADLEKEFVSRFADDLDTSEVSDKLKELKFKRDALKGEMDLIDNHDFKEKELAQAVCAEFRELQRQVNGEMERLWQQSEKIKDDAEAAINEINKQLEELSVQFVKAANTQVNPIIPYLGSGVSTDELIRQISNGLVGAYTSVRNIQRQ